MRAKGSRQTSFRGCWTCKTRKVRCDERPVACRNCEKRGITCGGYDIRLQWIYVADPFASISGSEPRHQGRRKIVLANSYRYCLEEVDQFISEIDDNADHGVCSGRGPFSVFPATEHPFLADQSSRNISVDNVTPTALQSIGMSSEECNHDIDAEMRSPAIHYSATPETINNSESTSHSSLELSREDVLLEFEGYDIPSLEDATTTSNIWGSASMLETDSILKPTTPEIGDEISLSINGIYAPLFGSKTIDQLLTHYMTNIADLLLPILHEKNPWRILYMPTIFDAAAVHYFAPEQAHGKANSALYYAALSVASFHIWYAQRDKDEFHKMGTFYKCKAMHSLQLAVSSTKPGTEYRHLLMAMLSLVTTGVMSGDCDDFQIHLKATARLKSSREGWKLVSNSTRQLNEISAFISLIARTMSFQDHSPLTVDPACTDQPTGLAKFEAELGCCEYMYGIARSTAAMIHETCVLADKIRQYENIHIYDDGQLRIGLPADLLEQCESLGERLLSWKLLPEDVLSISINGSNNENDEDSGPLMMASFTHHAKAWHYAALVYYFRRIQGLDSADMTEEIDQIIEHMYAFETAKAQRRFPSNHHSPSATATDTVRMAPITWPMFIASCEALPNQREKIKAWWVEAQGYQLANITRQWLVVQRIWATQDENREKNIIGDTWVDIFSALGISLLPL